MLFDSHAHYFDDRFSEELDTSVDGLLCELFANDVKYIINVATNPKNALVALDMARAFSGMYAAVGLHPEDARYSEDVEADLRAIDDIIVSSMEEGKIVAIGEIGFDYHYEGYDKEKQRYCFEYQLDMAKRLGLPVIIHDRDAHGDVFETVLKYTGVKGVFHSYSGSAEMAKELQKRGWYISFSGVLTFKNAAKSKEVARIVDEDKVLIETDCPYLAPHPHRGKLNHSGLMRHTAEALAEIKGVTYDEICRITENNAKRLFGIK
jgi:TatD DNase family protein